MTNKKVLASAHYYGNDYLSVLSEGMGCLGISDLDWKDIIFLCVGTSRSLGDRVGPLVGESLKSKGFTVYGTMDDQVHALNISDVYEQIKREYPDRFIFCVDACVTEFPEKVGLISLVSSPLRPGTGVGKELGSYGDCCISGVTLCRVEDDFETNVLLHLVGIGLVKSISEKIVEVISLYFCGSEDSFPYLDKREVKYEYV